MLKRIGAGGPFIVDPVLAPYTASAPPIRRYVASGDDTVSAREVAGFAITTAIIASAYLVYPNPAAALEYTVGQSLASTQDDGRGYRSGLSRAPGTGTGAATIRTYVAGDPNVTDDGYAAKFRQSFAPSTPQPRPPNIANRYVVGDPGLEQEQPQTRKGLPPPVVAAVTPPIRAYGVPAQEIESGAAWTYRQSKAQSSDAPVIRSYVVTGQWHEDGSAQIRHPSYATTVAADVGRIRSYVASAPQQVDDATDGQGYHIKAVVVPPDVPVIRSYSVAGPFFEEPFSWRSKASYAISTGQSKPFIRAYIALAEELDTAASWTYRQSLAPSTLPAPVTADQSSGGWPYFYDYAWQRRQRLEQADQDRRDGIRDARARSETEAQIARLLHEKLQREEEQQNLDRLKELVVKYRGLTDVPQRVHAAFVKAGAERTFSRLQALQRELIRFQEEEEMALLMILLADE
jgi:hypothetical protein